MSSWPFIWWRRNIIFLRTCLVAPRRILVFMVEQVFLLMQEAWLMYNVDTQCTVYGERRPKDRENFLLNFPCLAIKYKFYFTSVQFSSVTQLCLTLWPHGLQHTRPPCPSLTPGVHPNPCPLSRWCHPPISSSVVPFSSCPQSFPASGCFPMSQLFASGGQSIGVSVSTSVLPMNTQDSSPLGWTGWISLQSKGFSRVFSNVHRYLQFLCLTLGLILWSFCRVLFLALVIFFILRSILSDIRIASTAFFCLPFAWDILFFIL